MQLFKRTLSFVLISSLSYTINATSFTQNPTYTDYKLVSAQTDLAEPEQFRPGRYNPKVDTFVSTNTVLYKMHETESVGDALRKSRLFIINNDKNSYPYVSVRADLLNGFATNSDLTLRRWMQGEATVSVSDERYQVLDCANRKRCLQLSLTLTKTHSRHIAPLMHNNTKKLRQIVQEAESKLEVIN